MSRISRFRQIKIYVGKCFRLFVNEHQWKNFLSTTIIMILICMVTSDDMFVAYKDTKNGAFAVICACIWIGLFNSIQSICRERAVIKHEHHTGLHISSYVTAHAAYEFFLCFFESIIIVVIMLIKNRDHLPDDGLILSMGLDMYITVLLIVFSSDMLAIMLSCIVKTEGTAMTVMPFVLIIQLVMCGAFFELSGFTEKIADFTISKWGLNAMCAIANTTKSVNLEYEFLGGQGCDPTSENLWKIWGLLVLFSIVYVIIGTLFLKRVDKDKR